MSGFYCQNYSEEEVAAILKEIQDCICKGRYTISKNSNREDNLELIREYNLPSYKQRQILLQIKTEDFCHSLQNKNIGFEHETLYVFCPQVKLFNLDNKEMQVDIYIKFNIIEYFSGSRIIVVSFHERKRPIDYCFR